MELAELAVKQFTGYQMGVQKKGEESYLCRGEIASTAVEDNELRIKFFWLAKGVIAPAEDVSCWVEEEEMIYVINLDQVYSVDDIGGGRMCLLIKESGEILTLFPPEKNKLN